MPRAGSSARQRDSESYREAARLALDQLDWCISYLHRINKPTIAERLRENRRSIIKRYGL